MPFYCSTITSNIIPKKEISLLSETELKIVFNGLIENYRKANGFRDFIIVALMAIIKTNCKNDKKPGEIPGAIAVLQTHSKKLNFHPHIHLVMPAATVDKTSRLWKNKSGKYLFNHKAIAKVFRAKILKSLKKRILDYPQSIQKNGWQTVSM